MIIPGGGGGELERSTHFRTFITPRMLDGLACVKFCSIAKRLKYFYNFSCVFMALEIWINSTLHIHSCEIPARALNIFSHPLYPILQKKCCSHLVTMRWQLPPSRKYLTGPSRHKRKEKTGGTTIRSESSQPESRTILGPVLAVSLPWFVIEDSVMKMFACFSVGSC